jgi:hypothetical protein
MLRQGGQLARAAPNDESKRAIYVRRQFAKLSNMPVDAIGSATASGKFKCQRRNFLALDDHCLPILVVLFCACIDV